MLRDHAPDGNDGVSGTTVTPMIGTLFDGPIDIVGDIHGEIDAMRDLLKHMGYDVTGVHSNGRRLVFIGDLADRGPNSPAVFALVSALVARGLAQCVLGNHELNLLRQARKDGNGWYFAENHDREENQFLDSEDLAASDRMAVESFLSTLPLALERRDLRLAHASWHQPAIDTVRSSSSSAVEVYADYDARSQQQAAVSGLTASAERELETYARQLKDPEATVPLLAGAAALDELIQMGNPIRIITSGLERVAQRPFFASGKWRMVDRVPWWNDYIDATPVIIGHYWRWPTRASRDAYSRGEPDLFADYESHHWLGANRNVFCVDFAVGARYKERTPANDQRFACRLAAVRWPEQQLIFDNGQTSKLS